MNTNQQTQVATQIQMGTQSQPTTATQGEPFNYQQIPVSERFVYAPKYNDWFFGLIFYLMMLTLLVVCIITYAGSSVPSVYGEVIGYLVLLMVIGAVGGIIALQVVKCIPATIIKVELFGMIGLYTLGGIILLASSSSYLGIAIVFFIIAAITLIYTWAVWSRIPFTGVLLTISGKICSTYDGVIWTALAALVIEFFFMVLWILVVIQVAYSGSGIGYILMVLAFYWGVQVFGNVSHTTTCGVAATWYFYKEHQANVTWESFKRAMTTSFGSICYGSLLIAIIQTIRAMARSGGGRGNIICCLCLILLCCCEAFLRFFTEYAFAYVAIYGRPFYESGRMTWQLLERRGWWAIVNTSLINLALTGGCFISAIIVGIVGALIGLNYGTTFVILLAVVGFFVGYFMAQVVLHPVKSAVIALFIAYAEDPDTLKQNHEEEYARLTNANPALIVTVQVIQVATIQTSIQTGPGQVQYIQGQPQYVQGQPQYIQGQNGMQPQYGMQPQQQYVMQPQQQYVMQPQQQQQYAMQPQQQYAMQPQQPYQTQPGN